MSKNALVTGAAGHIGNVLVRELLSHEYQVRALILPGEDVSALEGLEIERVEGDVLKPDTLDSALKGFDFVFHLAGIVSIMPGEEALMQQVNVEGTKNMLQAALRAGVKRFVYTSSIHALSRKWQGTISEETPFDVQNTAGAYDRTKAEASLAVLEAAKQGLDVVIVCPTGVIGPFDYRKSEMGSLLSDWMQRRIHMLVEGAYDFVDVRDVARGQRLALERGKKGEVYILSGHQIQLFQLKELVQKIKGLRTPTLRVPFWLAKFATLFSPLYYRLSKQTPKFTEYALETVNSNSLVSNAKARQELGYSTRKIMQTIKDTVAWLQKQRSAKRA